MRSFITLCGLLVLFSSPSAAQSLVSWGLGANVSFPASDLGDQAATGYGGTAMLRIGIVPLIDLTGGVEYLTFGTKDITVAGANGESCAKAWGYMVGGRVNLFAIAYGGLELGGYSFSTKFEVPSLPAAEGSNTEFFFAPMAGVSLGMFDAGVRYVVADNFNFFSVRGMIWF